LISTGIISGALVLLGSDLGHELTNSEKQLVTSLTSGGAFVGALVAACVADIVRELFLYPHRDSYMLRLT
jgi:hypothetical protein